MLTGNSARHGQLLQGRLSGAKRRSFQRLFPRDPYSSDYLTEGCFPLIVLGAAISTWKACSRGPQPTAVAEAFRARFPHCLHCEGQKEEFYVMFHYVKADSLPCLTGAIMFANMQSISLCPPPPPPPAPSRHLQKCTREWRPQCPPKRTGSAASKRWQAHFTQPASRYLSKSTKSESLKYPDQLRGKRLTPSSQLLLARRPKAWLEVAVESRVLDSYG